MIASIVVFRGVVISVAGVMMVCIMWMEAIVIL
jgi:hypothetical protein